MAFTVKAPLVIVKNEDGSDRYIYSGAPLPAHLSKEELGRLLEAELIEEVGQPETGTDGPPARSASKADWEAYARTQGASDDDLDGVTKDDLVSTYGA